MNKMKYSNIILFIVKDSHYFIDFSFGREDIGNVHVDIYYFDTFKSLLKEFSHWCEESIDKYVFTNSHEANIKAYKMTKEKLSKIKAKLKTQEDFKKFKKLYPTEEMEK